MPTAFLSSAASKRRQRIWLGGAMVSCRLGEMREHFSIAPPGEAGTEPGRAARIIEKEKRRMRTACSPSPQEEGKDLDGQDTLKRVSTGSVPEFQGNLRSFMLHVPEEIRECSGIRVFGKTIRSLAFTTDAAIIRNCNADAVIAVYPFTPQPLITQAVMTAADMPVFAGIGGGLTQGMRVIDLALHAEFQGAIGVVVNAPTKNETVRELVKRIDIPVVVTVASFRDDVAARVEAGVRIINVSAAAETARVVQSIRERFPDLAIIATGGPTKESIRETIRAGANAITWTPPSSGQVFRDIMQAYREGKPHP